MIFDVSDAGKKRQSIRGRDSLNTVCGDINSRAYWHVRADKRARCILLLTNRNTLSADELSADDDGANKQAVIGKQLQEYYRRPAEHSLVTISVPLSQPFAHYPFGIHAHTRAQCWEGCFHPSVNSLLLIRIIRSQTSFSLETEPSSSWGIPKGLPIQTGYIIPPVYSGSSHVWKTSS